MWPIGAQYSSILTTSGGMRFTDYTHFALGPTVVELRRDLQRSGMRPASQATSPCATYDTARRKRARFLYQLARNESIGNSRFCARSLATSSRIRSDWVEDFDSGWMR